MESWAPWIALGLIVLSLVWRGSWLISQKADKKETVRLERAKVSHEDCQANVELVRIDRAEIWKEVGANRVAIGDTAKEFAEFKGMLRAYADQMKEHNRLLIDTVRKINGGNRRK